MRHAERKIKHILTGKVRTRTQTRLLFADRLVWQVQENMVGHYVSNQGVQVDIDSVFWRDATKAESRRIEKGTL